MSAPIDLSICIVTWDRKDLLESCLRSISAHTHEIRHEIIVVDNGSTDGTRRLLAEGFPSVIAIRNERNLGFTRANNQAMRRSQGRYLFLLNSDTEVRDGALDVLVTFMDSHPEAGAGGPRLINPDGSLQPSCYNEISLLNTAFGGSYFGAMFQRVLPGKRYAAEFLLPASAHEGERTVDWVTGAAIIARREAV